MLSTLWGIFSEIKANLTIMFTTKCCGNTIPSGLRSVTICFRITPLLYAKHISRPYLTNMENMEGCRTADNHNYLPDQDEMKQFKWVELNITVMQTHVALESRGGLTTAAIVSGDRLS